MKFEEAIKTGKEFICKINGLKYRVKGGAVQYLHVSGEWENAVMLLKVFDSECEIVEDKKVTLSDEVESVSIETNQLNHDGYEYKYPEERVKQFIKDIKEDVEEKVNKQMKGTSQMFIDGLRYVKEIINKRAGKRLI